MIDQYLLALKWLSPAAKTRAGDMVAEGGRAATRPGMKAPEGELDAFLFEVGRSRGQALMVVDSVARALDAAGDLAPARPEGAMETDRGRTYAERIEVLVKLARECIRLREAAAHDLREYWALFCSGDWFPGCDTFAERMETAGFAECAPVDSDALKEAFAADRGLEPDGMMWQLTEAGHAVLGGAMK